MGDYLPLHDDCLGIVLWGICQGYLDGCIDFVESDSPSSWLMRFVLRYQRMASSSPEASAGRLRSSLIQGLILWHQDIGFSVVNVCKKSICALTDSLYCYIEGASRMAQELKKNFDMTDSATSVLFPSSAWSSILVAVIHISSRSIGPQRLQVMEVIVSWFQTHSFGISISNSGRIADGRNSIEIRFSCGKFNDW